MDKNNTKKASTFHTITISKETNKLLSKIKQRIDKKDFGKKSKRDRIIQVALKQISEDEKLITMLQDETLSERNRLEKDHQEYCKKNGKISIDAYLGKLRRGELFEDSKKEKSVTENQPFTPSPPPVFPNQK